MQLVIGWLLVAAFTAVAAVLGDYHRSVRLFQASWLVGFAGYGLTVRALWTLPGDRVPGRWPVWLLGFVVLRLALLHTAPSDDLHRYVWEGKVQRHGFNPYVVPPTDARLVDLRSGDRNWARINHPEYPAIYPPLAQLLFRGTSRISESIWATKLVLVGLEVVAIVLLGYLLRLLGVLPQRVAVYALSPLSLTAFGIEGHMDSLMLALMAVAAVCAVRRSFHACGVALGLAISAKLVSVVFLPWIALKKPTAAVLGIVIALMTYLPFGNAGWDVFEALARFGATENHLGFLVVPLQEMLSGEIARWICALALAVFVAYLTAGKPSFPVFATRAMAAVPLFVPVVHMWYLTWFLAFAWSRLRVCWLVLTGSMVFYFEAEYQRALSGQWSMAELVYLPVYAPFVVASLVEWFCRRRAGPTAAV